MDRLELERAADLSATAAAAKRNTFASSSSRAKVRPEHARLPGTKLPGYAGGKTYTPHKSASRWVAALLTCKRRSRCNLTRYPGASKLLEELYDHAIAHGGDLRDDRAAESISADVGWVDPESVRRHSVTVMKMGEAYVAAGAGCSSRSDGRAWHGLPTNLRILTRPLAFLHLAPARLRAELLADAGVRAALAWLRAVAAAASAVVPARSAAAPTCGSETPTFVGGSMSLEAFTPQTDPRFSPFIPPWRPTEASPAPELPSAGVEARPGPVEGAPAAPESLAKGAGGAGAASAGEDRPEPLHGPAPAPAAPLRGSEGPPSAPATALVAIDERGSASPSVAAEWARRRVTIARDVLEALAPLLAATAPLPAAAPDPRVAAAAAVAAAHEARAAAELELEQARLDLKRERITRARALASAAAGRRAAAAADDLVDFRRSPRRWTEQLEPAELEQLRHELEQLEPRLLETPWPAAGFDDGGAWREVLGAAAVLEVAISTAVRRRYGGDHG